MAHVSRINYDPPVDGGVICTHCGGPLVAVAELRHGGYFIDGCRDYDWRHAGNLDRQCPPVYRSAQPYDGWKATALIEAALDARRAAEDALLDAEEATDAA